VNNSASTSSEALRSGDADRILQVACTKSTSLRNCLIQKKFAVSAKRRVCRSRLESNAKHQTLRETLARSEGQ
jgi:hypothetical protein